MFIDRQKVQGSAEALENVAILVVSPHAEDASALRQILRHSDWNLTFSTGAAEAAEHLTARTHSVIICERDLPDGSWKNILQQTEQLANTPLLLVVSKHADENLWAEVLNLGGYDVLLKPFDRGEVVRVVNMAWRCWLRGLREATGPPFAPQFA